MARVFIALVLSSLIVLSGAPGSASDDVRSLSNCTTDTNLLIANVSCESAAGTIRNMQAESGSAHWEFWQLCMSGTSGGAEVCYNPRRCTVEGTPGTWYIVRRDGVTVGRACLTVSEEEELSVSIAALAARAFRELEWPASRLSVQPPGGRTLVNLETVFFTSNSEPTLRSVTLVGRQVEIEATPVAFAWDFGDGAGDGTTSPGRPYPDHDVFHVYARTGTWMASVATTYEGRWRFNGGPWREIAETLTVAGPREQVDVVEARPELVVD